MLTAAIILHIIVSVILIIVVLFQVGKGATIGSTFGGGSASQTVFGASGGATLLGKITTTCAIIFMCTSLYLTYASTRKGEVSVMGELPEVGVPAEEKAQEPSVPALPEPVIPEPGGDSKAAPATDSVGQAAGSDAAKTGGNVK